VGAGGVTASLKALHDEQSRPPVHARSALNGIAAQPRALFSEIDRLETQILAWHCNDETSRWLATIPGIGPITASAIAAAAPDISLFRSGRQFPAWLGLTPRPDRSGGKERLGGITKQGDGYLRRLLVVGAIAGMRVARKDASRQLRMAQLLERKPIKIATVAIANKTARTARAVMARKEVYTPAAV
jgi:transposase